MTLVPWVLSKARTKQGKSWGERPGKRELGSFSSQTAKEKRQNLGEERRKLFSSGSLQGSLFAMDDVGGVQGLCVKF